MTQSGLAKVSMRKLFKHCFCALAAIGALGCVVLVADALYEWTPLNPFGKRIGALEVREQAFYLILEDQLMTNSALEAGRASGGEIAIAGDYAACEKNSPLGLKLASLTAGKLRTHVDCSGAAKEFIFADLGPGGIQAGYACGGLCGNGNFYTVLTLWRIPIVIKSVGYVN